MARFQLRNDTMQMEAAPISNGTTRFRVTGPDGTIYDMTGVVTDFEVTLERDEVSCDRYAFERGGFIPAGPIQQTMTFTVNCTLPIRRIPGSLPRRGPSADLHIYDEAMPPARPAVDANEFRHDYQHNPEEPGICAVSDCGMWPEHHDHVRTHPRQNRCVCTSCMPDADDLPDDQHTVDARTSATFMRPGATSSRSHP